MRKLLGAAPGGGSAGGGPVDHDLPSGLGIGPPRHRE